MRGLIQRVSQASVSVNGELVGEVGCGLLLLLGVQREDGTEAADKLLHKVTNYRVFPDQNKKMNCSLLDVSGELLIVSQFTLVADTDKGLRPGFSQGADPGKAEKLYNYFVNSAMEKLPQKVSTGSFAADMQVSLCNDGPVTFLLEV